MNSQNSRKIIVASGMAVVVGAVIFAVHAHHDTLAAQAPPPPTPFTEVPAAPAAVAQTPGAPATDAQTPDAPGSAVAQTPDVPAALPPNESIGTKAPTP
jgi:hypothetical protein